MSVLIELTLGDLRYQQLYAYVYAGGTYVGMHMHMQKVIDTDS